LKDFSHQALERYHRQLILPEFGPLGQKRLEASKVLVVGAGGLGCPILQYLAAAGVGNIGIIDNDVVNVSNLHRQILFTLADVGRPKAEVAAYKISLLNPLIKVRNYSFQLTRENALDIFKEYDIIVDGSDNFPTRYLVNDACVICDKPLVYGSIYKFEGQVSVFNADRGGESRSANYRDLFPIPPSPSSVPSCNDIGVLGVSAGIIGCIQANETIKLLAQIGKPLIEKLFILDALHFTSHIIGYRKRNHTPITSLIDYEHFCNQHADSSSSDVSISPTQLHQLILEDSNIYLVDVRQEIEYNYGSISSKNIALENLVENIPTIPTENKIIVFCKSGKRSKKALKILVENGYINVAYLAGGLTAYRNTIEPSVNIL